jgi:hypothetical protein
MKLSIPSIYVRDCSHIMVTVERESAMVTIQMGWLAITVLGENGVTPIVTTVEQTETEED